MMGAPTSDETFAESASASTSPPWRTGSRVSAKLGHISEVAHILLRLAGGEDKEIREKHGKAGDAATFLEESDKIGEFSSASACHSANPSARKRLELEEWRGCSRMKSPTSCPCGRRTPRRTAWNPSASSVVTANTECCLGLSSIATCFRGARAPPAGFSGHARASCPALPQVKHKRSDLSFLGCRQSWATWPSRPQLAHFMSARPLGGM